jgi:hypothetical protein
MRRHSVPSERRPARGLSAAKIALILGLALAAAAFGRVESANAVVFVDYELFHPCCNNDPLSGTRASIRTPSSSISVPSTQCVAFRSDAEGHTSTGAGRLIQTGFVRCGTNANVDGTCATTNKQVRFVEILNSTGYHCYSHGSVGTSANSTYQVSRNSSNVWTAYIGGTADSHNVTFGTTDGIVEGGEYTGGCSDSVNVPAVSYGVTRTWQRWNDSSWVTVGSSYTTGDVCGFNLNGGPTGQWSITK